MPPKRKSTTATKAGGKKAKEDPGPSKIQDAIATLKSADTGKSKSHKPDQHCVYASNPNCCVYEDYNCMLNQTNIKQNNNKFYVIQVLKLGSTQYVLFTRWGRVGERGQMATEIFANAQDAVKGYNKKYSAKKRKYTEIEVEQSPEDEDEVDAPTVPAKTSPSVKVEKCSLDAPTQSLIKLIFDRDMFNAAMSSYDIDVKKMPLGKLSKSQIARGFECLEELQTAVETGKPQNIILSLSSRFYTLIPHNFGRKVPPAINTQDALQKKYDMLMVLGDIEAAQSMQKDTTGKETAEKRAHELDINYQLLNCDLQLVDEASKEYKIIQKYIGETCTRQTRFGIFGKKTKAKYIWRMNRDHEEDRHKPHSGIENRKLLWHGTNVAVVAAILKQGLRIMPHSGGALGRGIYFASEHSKSAGYVCPSNRRGLMFLNEVALGQQKHVKGCDPLLVKPPAGYGSVVGTGREEPDPKKDTSITLDGREVTVPQGKPVPQKGYQDSVFSQSEYLIYDESRVRMRYICEFEM